MRLSSLSAQALAAAIVAAASVLVLAHMPGLFVWAAFIGWASYAHSGATPQAAVRSSAALVFGVAMAWLVAMTAAAGTLAVNAPLATAISAGVASFLIVAASRLPLLAVVPATFYGFASTFAYLSLAPGASSVAAMTSLGWKNAAVSVPVSLLVGTALGVMHGRLAETLVMRPGDARGVVTARGTRQ
jgi:hypothetical protein